MKSPLLYKEELGIEEKSNLELELIKDNIRRGKILAIIVIGIEIVFLFISIISLLVDKNERFNYIFYITMYSLMVFVNLLFIVISNIYLKKPEAMEKDKLKLKTLMLLYLSFVMVWGSVISLADQPMYGQLISFMVNLITCSVIYQLSAGSMLVPYISSVLVLAVGLPFFQNSRDILIGHYVNIIVIVAVSWITSRLIYHYSYEFYCSKTRLSVANKMLEIRNEENRVVNRKLALANLRLKELAMLDELTGIPNRRSFREFVDRALNNCLGRINSKDDPCTISVIMIDLDYFKQYNDNYGHEEGDHVLTAVANVINALVEDSDEIAVRWGGEEFIYAAFDKSSEVIDKIAKTIHNRISECKIPHFVSQAASYLTASAGVCTVKIHNREDIQKAVKLADRALYAAKNNGRNCIICLNEDK